MTAQLLVVEGIDGKSHRLADTDLIHLGTFHVCDHPKRIGYQ